jgi:hypothetical protein
MNETYTSKTYTSFSSQPIPNTRISFGEGSNMHIQFHSNKKPNKFQRWMLLKLLGIKLEDI